MPASDNEQDCTGNRYLAGPNMKKNALKRHRAGLCRAYSDCLDDP
jgi:hypothetical protein